MLLALIGSHGTGKTSVFNILKEKYPDFYFFSEAVRHQVPLFGYKDPYQIVDSLGIGSFELMNINSWSVIDPKVNTALDIRKNIVTDRSVVDNFSYYLTLRKTKADFIDEKLIKGMAKHYASLIDRFIYFPLDKIPLKADAMRKTGLEYQKKIDQNIINTFKILKISKNKIYKLKSVNLLERVKEVEGFLS